MADFFTDAKFGVDTGQIPSLNLGGANALQTAVTNTTSNVPSRTGGVEYYRYPRQAMTESTDYLYLKVVKFKPPTFTVTKEAPYIEAQTQTQAQLQNEIVSGHVILPIPQSIGDANSVEWGSSNLNPLEAAGLAAAATGIKGGISGIVDVVKGGTKFISEIGRAHV